MVLLYHQNNNQAYICLIGKENPEKLKFRSRLHMSELVKREQVEERHAEYKQITEMVPGILNQLGEDSLTHIKRLASVVPSVTSGSGIPDGNMADDDDDDEIYTRLQEWNWHGDNYRRKNRRRGVGWIYLSCFNLINQTLDINLNWKFWKSVCTPVVFYNISFGS